MESAGRARWARWRGRACWEGRGGGQGRSIAEEEKTTIRVRRKYRHTRTRGVNGDPMAAMAHITRAPIVGLEPPGGDDRGRQHGEE